MQEGVPRSRVIGLLGVVPLGILGAFFKLGINDLGVSLCVMLVITLAARFAGAACASAADRYRAKLA
jgi:hypothetical protein